MKLEPVGPSRGPAPIRLPSGWRVPSRPSLVIGAVVALALLGVTTLPPDTRSAGARLAILVIGLLVAWRVLGRASVVTASSPERFEDALRKRAAEGFEISGLRAVETDVRMATANAFGVDMRLRPVFFELAQWRLERDHGVDIVLQPDAARLVLGEGLWRLVAPADAFPEFRAPGIPLADIEAGVDRLERI